MKQFMNIVNYILGGFINVCFVFVVLIALYIAVVKGIDYGKGIMKEQTSSKSPMEVIVTIPEDSSTQEIARILKNNGLINNEYFFWLQARLNGTYSLFKSGEFTLNLNMGSNEIMEILQQEQYAEEAYLTFTVAEGLNTKQIAALAESKGFFTAEEFIEACETISLDYDFLLNLPERDNRLEGYLFPDTYFLPQDPDPADLIIRMLNRFEDVYSDLMADIEDKGQSLDDIIKMAAIIEKEIKVPNERGLASSVIHNRLESNMPLEMCSTVIYVLDKPKDRLLYADLEVQSPYNTYINSGLPIGPICNPGKQSIQAAISPSETDYLYFVIKNEETGEHEFTNDFDDFLLAKERYNQRF